RVATMLVIGAMGVLASRAASAQGQDFSKVQIKVTKVSGNIYMLEGAGGNMSASVGEDGIAIVDDQYAPLAEKIQAALKDLGVTTKPVRFVINTHYHGDHTGGNELFGNAGSTLIAHANVRKRLERSEEHTSELQSRSDLVCRLLLEKKKKTKNKNKWHNMLGTFFKTRIRAECYLF